VKALLDTQAFLWFVLDDPRLGKRAGEIIADSDSTILLSPASHWEIAIKISLGKYELPEPFEAFMNAQIEENNFTVLPVSIAHTACVSGLPFHHRDPFDRLIIAQGLVEKISILSIDEIFDEYGVQRIW